ncbi:YveK family protein [Microbacterium sp. No. 7]|uniref:YveK family protein n=1 Tax=Microbacterium sp. No. 7 TaxID=1714373 RepID=UPI0006D188AC|nr:hypothetical protein [Microbacterium sp. No. 7]ALJ19076.1 hypothetical protein AOA12_03815 [Microbacterium sp. No. 7]
MTAGGPTWRDVVARWPLALGVFLIAIATSAIVGLVTPREYESTVRLYVYAASELEAPTVNQIVKGNQFAVAEAALAPTVVKSDANLQTVLDELSLSWSRPQLAATIDATTVTNSPIVSLTATSASPQDSQTIVESVARAYIGSLDRDTAGVPFHVAATPLEAPKTPATPSKPNLPAIFAIGVIVGVVFGSLAAYIVALVSRQAGSPDRLAAEAGGPLVAALGTPAGDVEDTSGRARTRWLAARLGRLARANGTRSIALTTARPGDDVRAVAERVTAALQADGVRVGVVDLVSHADGGRYAGDGTVLRRGGGAAASPLSAGGVRAARDEVEQSHDLVLWLVDPVSASADALAVAGGLDATVLVADRRTPLTDVRGAREALRFAGEEFAGVVVTSVRRAGELRWGPFLEDAPADVRAEVLSS